MTRWLIALLIMTSYVRQSLLQQQQGCVYNVGFMVSHAFVIYELSPLRSANNVPVYYSNDMMQFLSNLTVKLQPSSAGTHIGLVKFGNIASTQWDLNRFTANSVDLLSAFNADRISYDAGLSNMAEAFNATRYDVMSSSVGGSRPGVPNVCIMITVNEADINQTDFLPQAGLLKGLCRLIIIGVGPYATDAASDDYFKPAVTNPSTDFIKVQTFPQLADYVTTVFNLLCSASSNVSTTATTVSSTVNDFPPLTSPSIKTASPANNATRSTTTQRTNDEITTTSSSDHAKLSVVSINTSFLFGFFLLLSQLI